MTSSAIQIREAREEDYGAFCRFFPELAVPEPTPSVAAWREVLMSGALILESGEEALAYGRYETRAGRGHVTHLVVDPRVRRRGLGDRMMQAMAERLRAQGHAFWGLNVKPENIAAISLYQRMGLAPERRSTVLAVQKALLPRLPASTSEVRIEAMVAEEIPKVSNATGIHPGAFEVALSRSSDRALVIRCNDEVRGAACVRLPARAVFPFALKDASLLRPALEQLAARPECGWGMNFGIDYPLAEGSQLIEALEAAGAPRVMEILYLSGKLK